MYAVRVNVKDKANDQNSYTTSIGRYITITKVIRNIISYVELHEHIKQTDENIINLGKFLTEGFWFTGTKRPTFRFENRDYNFIVEDE